MTRFWNFIFGLDSTYSKEERKLVVFASRSMSNFIEQQLYPLNFRSDFSRLIIQCSKKPVEQEFYLSKDPAMATIYINLDLKNFAQSEESMHQAFSLMLTTAVERTLKYASLPDKEILEALDEFKSNAWVNQWNHADKLWKNKKYRCVIKCDHRIDAFYLTQKIYKDDVLIVEEIIAKTKPRELLFDQFLGRLVLKDNCIIYTNKKKVISTFDIEKRELEFSKSNIDI